MSVIQWSPDSEIVKRHFAHLGLRAALTIGLGVCVVPVATRFVTGQLRHYKPLCIACCKNEEVQSSAYKKHADTILECEEEPDATFGKAVLHKFGGLSGVTKIVFGELLHYVKDFFLSHAARIATLYGLNALSRSALPFTSVLTLQDTPFPSYVALWDFGNTSHFYWWGRVCLNMLPNVTLRYVLEDNCCANPDISAEQIMNISAVCDNAACVKWQFALIAPCVGIIVARSAEAVVRRVVTGEWPVVTSPSWRAESNIGKKLRFLRTTFAGMISYEAALVAVETLGYYLVGRFGPKLGGLTWFFDARRGKVYAWSAMSEVFMYKWLIVT